MIRVWFHLFDVIAWNENIELCPDGIYLELTGKKPEELFPRISLADVDA